MGKWDEKARERQKQRRAKNREKINSYYREYRKGRKPRDIAKLGPRSWEKFNGTMAQYDKYWKRQKGLCGICDKPLIRIGHTKDKSKMGMFDHCHRRNAARGILCVSCNLRLDWAEIHITKILDYLNYITGPE